MNRTAKGALIGGGVGALVAVAQTVRAEDDPPQVVAIHALRGAAQGALAGAVVGWILDRTARAEATGLAAYSELARDAWAGALETAEHALEAARPVVEQAVDQAVEAAVPVVELAAEVARERAGELAAELVERAETARRRIA